MEAQTKPVPCPPHDWWLHNINLWRCAKCGGLTRSPAVPEPYAKATKEKQ